MKQYVARVLSHNDKELFQFPVIVSGMDILSDVPYDHLFELVQQSNQPSFSVSIDRFRFPIYPAILLPSSVKLFMEELEGLMEPIRPYAEFPTSREAIRQSVTQLLRSKLQIFLPVACAAAELVERANLQDKARMEAYINNLLGTSGIWEERSLLDRVCNIASVELIDDLNPLVGAMRTLLSDSSRLPRLSLVAAVQPDALVRPWAVEDRIQVEQDDRYHYTVGRYVHSVFQQETNGKQMHLLRLLMHPQWQHHGDNLSLRLLDESSLISAGLPFLEYALDSDGEFYVAGNRIPHDYSVSLDIPCDGRTVQLYVTLPDIEALDMMYTTSVSYELYMNYSILANVYYPVKLRLEHPMQVMYCLDRMSTLLLSGVYIHDNPVRYDEDGNVIGPRRYSGVVTLTNLLIQTLVQTQPARTLNELAYRILMLNKILRQEKLATPWCVVTLNGLEDRDAYGFCRHQPLTMRSYPSLDEYIKERLVIEVGVYNENPPEDKMLTGLFPPPSTKRPF